MRSHSVTLVVFNYNPSFSLVQYLSYFSFNSFYDLILLKS